MSNEELLARALERGECVLQRGSARRVVLLDGRVVLIEGDGAGMTRHFTTDEAAGAFRTAILAALAEGFEPAHRDPPKPVAFTQPARPPPPQPPPPPPTSVAAPLPEGMKRLRVVRLERDDPNALAWQELVLDGARLFESYGRQVRGQPSMDEVSGQRFASETAATEALEGLLKQRKRHFKRVVESYRDVPLSRWNALAPAKRDLAQEAVLDAAAPEAFEAAARVYADWLTGQGDPRGELASLLQQGGAADAYLRANDTALLGELDVRLGSEVTQLQWQGGFLRGAGLKRRSMDSIELEALTRMFLALPLARFVTSLRFGLATFESDNDWTDTLKEVCAARGPFIRELRFDDYQTEDSELSWAPFGDLSSFWAQLPSLEHLTLRSGAGGELGTIAHPKLKTFIRESGGLSSAELSSIFSAQWPALERLDLWFGDPDWGAEGDVTQVTPFLRGDAPPKLQHLGLMNCAFISELLPAVLASPLLPRLKVLDLSMGVLGDDDVDTLVANAERLKHLEVLNLSESCFSPNAVAQLRAALPRAKLDEQREAGDDRYVAVGE